MSTAVRLVLLTFVLSIAWSATAQPRGTSLEVASYQRGPAALRGYLASAGAFLYETARIENISGTPITGIVFGVLLVEPDNPATRQLLRSSTVKVSLPPGSTRDDVKVELLTASELEAFERISARPKVILGVLAVEWADGRQWRFELDEDAIDFKAGVHRVLKRAGQ